MLELIGETRAAVVDGFRLVEMHIARDGDGLAAGARVEARLARKLGGRGIAVWERQELLLEPWPAGATEGAMATVEVVRAAWRESGRERLAKARPTALAPWPAPGLVAGLVARGHVLKPGWPADVAGQWDDGFEAAALGLLRFETGSLVLEPTPAFTAVDVDGHGLSLAKPALLALARAIRLWGLGGGIVIDLPSGPDKAERTTAAEGFDKAMAGLVFERTAINGFGLMQVVRPRPGPSILERARIDRAGTAAVELLAVAVADKGTAPMRISASPAVAAWIATRPHLLDELRRQTHRQVDLVADPVAGAGHVDASSSR